MTSAAAAPREDFRSLQSRKPLLPNDVHCTAPGADVPPPPRAVQPDTLYTTTRLYHLVPAYFRYSYACHDVTTLCFHVLLLACVVSENPVFCRYLVRQPGVFNDLRTYFTTVLKQLAIERGTEHYCDNVEPTLGPRVERLRLGHDACRRWHMGLAAQHFSAAQLASPQL